MKTSKYFGQDIDQQKLHWLGPRRTFHGVNKLFGRNVAPRYSGERFSYNIFHLHGFQIYMCKQFLKRQIVTDVAGLIIFKNKQVLYTVSTEVIIIEK